MSRLKVCFRWLEYNSGIKKITKKCGLEINEEERTVKVKGKTIQLTRKEFDLLYLLFRKIDQILTYDYILETVWGHDYNSDLKTHTLESHISSLRKKLGPHCAKKIININGSGYKLLSE